MHLNRIARRVMHAADRGARGHLEFARALSEMKEAANSGVPNYGVIVLDAIARSTSDASTLKCSANLAKSSRFLRSVANLLIIEHSSASARSFCKCCSISFMPVPQWTGITVSPEVGCTRRSAMMMEPRPRRGPPTPKIYRNSARTGPLGRCGSTGFIEFINIAN